MSRPNSLSEDQEYIYRYGRSQKIIADNYSSHHERFKLYEEIKENIHKKGDLWGLTYHEIVEIIELLGLM